MSELRRADAALTEQDKTDIRRDLGLGTAAVANVPASGAAAAGEVVKGNDPRLTDARTPTTHSHTVGDVSGAETPSGAQAKADAAQAAAIAAAAADATTKANAAAASSVPLTQKGAANGVATLDGTGKVPSSQLPAIAISEYLGAAANQAAMLALSGQQGDWCTRTDLGTTWVISGSDPTQLASWTQLSYPVAPVTSVAGRTGAVTLSASDVSGLGTAATTDASAYATAAQGTDSREWTAATVDQAEAEAGAATTRRAWTAQRVSQAFAAQVAAWWATASTAAGRALVTAADAAAQRTAIGAAAVAATNTFTAGQRGAIVALTDGATITTDMATGNFFAVTLAGNRTLANPTNVAAGQSGCFFVTQDATGSRTLAYGGYWKFAGGTAPTLTTAANAVDRIDYVVLSSTSIHAAVTKDIK